MRQNNLGYVRHKRLVYDRVIILFKSTQEVFTDCLRNSYKDCIMGFSQCIHRHLYNTAVILHFTIILKTTLQY